jgi:HK97 family phage prohead protease
MVLDPDAGTPARSHCRFLSEEPVKFEDVETHSDDTVTFSGYLLKWGDVANIRDMFGEYTETFHRGSMEKSFREYGPNGSRAIKLFRQHDNKVALAGTYTDLHEDDIGPAFSARTISTTTGKDLAVEIREGEIQHMSIGFDPITEEYDKERSHFDVREARIWEASPVYWPAYSSGTIDQFRALERMPAMMGMLERAMQAIRDGEEIPVEMIGQIQKVRGMLDEILGTLDSSHTEDTETPDDFHVETLLRLRFAEANWRQHATEEITHNERGNQEA